MTKVVEYLGKETTGNFSHTNDKSHGKTAIFF